MGSSTCASLLHSASLMDWLGIFLSLWVFATLRNVAGLLFWDGKMTGALTADLASARVRDESEALCGFPDSIQLTSRKHASKKNHGAFLVSYRSLANYHIESAAAGACTKTLAILRA